MSADAWRVCPKCRMTEESKQESLRKKAAEMYGKVPEREYLALVDAADEEVDLRQSLREDYQVYTNEDGTFSVNYRCHCCACNFKFEYKFEEELLDAKL